MPQLTPEVSVNMPFPSKYLKFVSIITQGKNKRLIILVKSMYPRGFDSVSMIHILVMYVYEWKHTLFKLMSNF